MLGLIGQVLLLVVVHLTNADALDHCCPVKEVQGLGPLSGTYILVPTSPGTVFPPECNRDSCTYVKDDHLDPEKLFCFMFDRSVTSDVKCQENSVFVPQTLAGEVEASVLSLNKTEGEELLRISQAFPPPPEGEVVDFCDGSSLAFSEHVNLTHSYGGQCHTVQLDENTSASCLEQWSMCSRNEGGPQEAAKQAFSTEDPGCKECIDANLSFDTESLCSTCIGICPPSHPLLCWLCNPHLNNCPGTTTPTTANTQLSYLPSWSLKWCPRRIGNNPNRLRRFPQCCFHPITQRPKGKLWGCLRKYKRT